MYIIDSKNVTFDKDLTLETERKRMKNGVKLKDFTELMKLTKNEFDSKVRYFSSEYGINPASPKQVADYLLKLNRAEVNAVLYDYRGKVSCKAENLEELSLLGYSIADELLEFRAIDSIRKCLNSLTDSMDSNRVIRPEVNLGVTKRWEYKKPALNSIPKDKLWDIVGARSNEYSIWTADIKNQEPTIIGELKDVTEITNRLQNNGDGLYEDMYRWCYEDKAVLTIVRYGTKKDSVDNVELSELSKLTKNDELYSAKRVASGISIDGEEVVAIVPKCVSCDISKKLSLSDLPKTISVYIKDIGYKEVNVTWEVSEADLGNGGTRACAKTIYGNVDWQFKIEKKVRKEFKTSWIALGYGMGKKALKASCKLIDADRLWDKFYSIGSLKEWRDSSAKKAKAGKREVDTYFGNKLVCFGESASLIARQIMDYEIQGTAADIFDLLVRHIDADKPDWLEIYFTRKDEIVYLAKNSIDDVTVKETIKQLTEHQVDDWVPFKVEIEKRV